MAWMRKQRWDEGVIDLMVWKVEGDVGAASFGLAVFLSELVDLDPDGNVPQRPLAWGHQLGFADVGGAVVDDIGVCMFEVLVGDTPFLDRVEPGI